MTPTRPAGDPSDCCNLEGGVKGHPGLTGANHSERKESSPQDVSGEGEQAPRPIMMMSFVWTWQWRKRSGASDCFCTAPLCNVNRTRWKRHSHISHVDNQTCCLFVFLVYLNIGSFDLWHTFWWTSVRTPVRVKLQWSLRYICFILICMSTYFLKLFSFFLGMSGEHMQRDGWRCCYGSPADKRRHSSLWWSAS